LLALLWGCASVISAESGNTTDAGFDWILANTTIELVDVAYCKPSSFKKYHLTGLLEGFKVTTGILSFNAFVGMLPLQKSIYVVFGGSSTVLDWMFDFDVQGPPGLLPRPEDHLSGRAVCREDASVVVPPLQSHCDWSFQGGSAGHPHSTRSHRSACPGRHTDQLRLTAGGE